MKATGYIPLRRGLLEHLEQGRLSSFDAGIYARILLEADHKTGIWWGSAAKLIALAPGDASLRAVQRALHRLEAIAFIRRFYVRGKHGNYPVLVNKFECTDGSLKGLRLNAEKSTDWRHPVYESPTGVVSESGSDVTPIQEERRRRKTIPLYERNGFAEFWEEYPRKEAKKDAARAWAKINPEEHPQVMAGLKRWKRSKQWQKDGGEFVLYAVRFLNKERWKETPMDLQPGKSLAQQFEETEQRRAGNEVS